MRHSNQSARGRRLPSGAAGVVALLVTAIAVACGGTTAAPSSTPVPTPVITPDPHLTEPVTADQIFLVLQRAKLQLQPNNANLGHGNPTIVKQINATLTGWPLRITQYRSAADLRKALAWKTGEAPAGDEAPYGIAGLNVLIQFGPISARAPAAPDSTRQATAAQLVGVLDPLLWPLQQHSVVPIPARTPEPTPAPPSASAKPSKAPAKSAPPKSPKPTKAP